MRLLLTLLVLIAAANNALAQGEWSYPISQGVWVRITESKFEQEKHIVELCAEGNFPCKIDGQFPYGTMLEWPATQLMGLIVHVFGKDHALDTSGMFNAWSGRPIQDEHQTYLEVRKLNANSYRVRGLFSGEVSSYVGEWLIDKQKARRTLLTNDGKKVHEITLALGR